MKQREVQGPENRRWTCVQAFTATDGAAAKQAERISGEDGKVEVICTPSGGEQTVRLTLDANWESLPDGELIKKISQARENK